jgi:hypothetical protein
MTFWDKREQSTTAAGLSRRGYVYQVSVERTLGNAASASCQFATGDLPVVVYLREVASTAAPVRVQVFEGATSGASGSVVGQNLNRGASVLESGSMLSASVTSASVTAELARDTVTAGKGSGGLASCSKVRTLEPNSVYPVVLTNLGNDTTTVALTLVWSEGEPEPFNPLDVR